MTENAIKAWNKKRNQNNFKFQKKLKKTVSTRQLRNVPPVVQIRQERIKNLLKSSGVNAPWELDIKDLYQVRAIQLGAVL